MKPKTIINTLSLAFLALLAANNVTAQNIAAASPLEQRMLADAAAASSPPSRPLPRPAMRLLVDQRLGRESEFALGLHGSDGAQGLDVHEINTAFAAQSQDPTGVAGARLSFHF